MSARHVFIDTNILVYAHDVDAGDKHERAKEKVREAWARSLPPSISVQVLQELYVNLVRKGATHQSARSVIEDYFLWDIVVNDTTLLTEGMRLAERLKVSLWDALIIAAARRAGAKAIWSEDLNEGQEYEGVRVVNPLPASSARRSGPPKGKARRFRK